MAENPNAKNCSSLPAAQVAACSFQSVGSLIRRGANNKPLVACYPTVCLSGSITPREWSHTGRALCSTTRSTHTVLSSPSFLKIVDPTRSSDDPRDRKLFVGDQWTTKTWLPQSIIASWCFQTCASLCPFSLLQPLFLPCSLSPYMSPLRPPPSAPTSPLTLRYSLYPITASLLP